MTVRPASKRVPAGLDAGDPSVVADHRCGFGLESDLGTRFDGRVHQCGVEAAARPHGSVVGEPVGGRPVELAHLFAGDHPKAADVVGVVERDLQFVERTDCARGQAVAADLVAPVRALLEHHDLGARSGRLDRRCRAGRPCPDDGDVDSLGTHSLNAAGTPDEKHRRAPEVTMPSTPPSPCLRCTSGGPSHPNRHANASARRPRRLRCTSGGPSHRVRHANAGRTGEMGVAEFGGGERWWW